MLELLDYPREIVLDEIYKMYKYDLKYLDMLESNRFYTIEKASDFRDEDDIWLTPRAACLCEYLGLKFVFMIAKIRSNPEEVLLHPFNYNDKIPVTPDTIHKNLSFLCRIACMHLNGLIKIRRLLNTKGKWLRYYYTWYCIRAYDAFQNESLGNLQFLNIIRSQIKFLRRYVRVFGEDSKITNTQIAQYSALRNLFRSLVKKLDNNEEFPDCYPIDIFTSCINEKVFKCD